MDNKITVFKSPTFGEMKTVEINGEPWFVGKDVAGMLGYRETANMRKLLDPADFKEINPQTPEFTGFVQNGTTQLEPNPNVRRMLLINESGLYQAIFGSTLQQAKEFKRWVTSEVLPTIRKHGAYMTDEVLKQSMQTPEFIIALATELKKEKEDRIRLEKQAEEDKPKVEFAENMACSETAIPMDAVAKVLKQNGCNIGRNRLYKDLQSMGMIMKDVIESGYRPTQRGVNSGNFVLQIKPWKDPCGAMRSSFTVLVTPKGVEWIVGYYSKVNK